MYTQYNNNPKKMKSTYVTPYAKTPTNELLHGIENLFYLIRGSEQDYGSRDLAAFDDMKEELEQRGYWVKEELTVIKK